MGEFTQQLSLRPEHGYVVLLVGLSFLTHFGLGLYVGLTRIKKYKVEYPIMYLDYKDKKSKPYNCMQRAHQNILENFPLHLVMLLVAGIYRPELSAMAGTIRLLGFIVYFAEYASGDPDRRFRGFFGYIGHWLHLLLVMELAAKMILDIA